MKKLILWELHQLYWGKWHHNFSHNHQIWMKKFKRLKTLWFSRSMKNKSTNWEKRTIFCVNKIINWNKLIKCCKKPFISQCKKVKRFKKILKKVTKLYLKLKMNLNKISLKMIKKQNSNHHHPFRSLSHIKGTFGNKTKIKTIKRKQKNRRNPKRN